MHRFTFLTARNYHIVKEENSNKANPKRAQSLECPCTTIQMDISLKTVLPKLAFKRQSNRKNGMWVGRWMKRRGQQGQLVNSSESLGEEGKLQNEENEKSEVVFR